MTVLTIIHVDTHREWRGGQKQVLELIGGLNRRGQRNILVCKADSEILDRARTKGFETVTLPLKGEWDLMSAWALRKLVKARSTDVVHTHTSHAHAIGLLSLLGVHDCRLVVSRRVDFHVSSTLSRRLKYGYRVDRFVTVSEAIKRILVSDGVDPAQITTIRSGFAPNSFEHSPSTRDVRAELGIDRDTPVICTVAALAPHKAHVDLLKAARIVRQRVPNVKFLLAGEGETRVVIEQHIRNLGLDDTVVMLGFVTDIDAVYRAADIFALSSEEEGLCTSLFDAMYFGLPIVATSAGGIPEIVIDRQNGYIVPVHNYESLAERLIELIEYPERRNKMSQRSQEVLKNHTVDHTIDQTLDLYRTLTGTGDDIPDA